MLWSSFSSDGIGLLVEVDIILTNFKCWPLAYFGLKPSGVSYKIVW